MTTLTFQGSLFGAESPVLDQRAAVERTELSAGAWIDVVRGAVAGHDELMSRVASAARWGQRTRRMYGSRVVEPRLTASWGTAGLPDGLGVVEELSALLGARYGVALDRVTANLYRDGDDAVAWHGDRVLRERPRAVVAVLTLGATRTFRLRPAAGGPGLAVRPSGGDLVVMGGTCQRTYEHAIPRTARPVGPRICVMLRHDPDADVPAR